MALVQNWFPPTRENYELINSAWQWLAVVAQLQWPISWYGMGKTSVNSRFNLNGRVAWLTMESLGFITVLYMMNTLPAQHGITDLPWQNKVLAGLFCIHYSYRAIMYPLMAPSMSPLHPLIWCFAVVFQLVNGTCLGAWLAAYGPTTQAEWRAQVPTTAQFVFGISVFYLGLAANYYHDDELREIRRREMARQQRLLAQHNGAAANEKKVSVEKHYQIPQAGLFKIMLYPHYFVEWIEWLGFYIACGWSCGPARCFLLNEIGSMLPRAVRGKWWYIEKFGEEKIRGKWAVIPGVW